MGRSPGAVGRAEEQPRAARLQRRDLVVHSLDLGDQPRRMAVIARTEQWMGRAVIGQQMPFRRDLAQDLRMGLGHTPDDEEGRLDIVLAQRRQHGARVRHWGHRRRSARWCDRQQGRNGRSCATETRPPDRASAKPRRPSSLTKPDTPPETALPLRSPAFPSPHQLHISRKMRMYQSGTDGAEAKGARLKFPALTPEIAAENQISGRAADRLAMRAACAPGSAGRESARPSPRRSHWPAPVRAEAYPARRRRHKARRCSAHAR